MFNFRSERAPLTYILLIGFMMFYTATGVATGPAKEYLRENMSYILLVTIVIIGILLYFDMIGFDLNPPKDRSVDKVVTIETFGNNIHKRVKDGFCETHKNDNHALEKDCNTFNEKNCKASGCCVWAKMKGDASKQASTCVAGNKHGPIFRTDDSGKRLDVDYYYYDNKCYGNCPTEDTTS